MRQVVSKMARRNQTGGKENSGVFDAPSAPTHRINANASTVSDPIRRAFVGGHTRTCGNGGGKKLKLCVCARGT